MAAARARFARWLTRLAVLATVRQPIDLRGAPRYRAWRAIPGAPTGTFRSERRYLPDTNVLETVFHTASGAVALRDLMPVVSEEDKRAALTPEHEVLREIEGLVGQVDRGSTLAPGLRPEASRLTSRGAFGLWCEVPEARSPPQRSAAPGVPRWPRCVWSGNDRLRRAQALLARLQH